MKHATFKCPECGKMGGKCYDEKHWPVEEVVASIKKNHKCKVLKKKRVRRWRASYERPYWHSNQIAGVHQVKEYGSITDIVFKSGNYFRTRAQAREFAKRVKKLAKEFHQEIGG